MMIYYTRLGESTLNDSKINTTAAGKYIVSGRTSVGTITGGGYVFSAWVPFGITFSDIPAVVATTSNANFRGTVSVYSLHSDTCMFRVDNLGTDQVTNLTVNWIAML